MFYVSKLVSSVVMYSSNLLALIIRHVSRKDGISINFFAVRPPSPITFFTAHFFPNNAILSICCSNINFSIAIYVSENVFYRWPFHLLRSVIHLTAVAANASGRASHAIETCSGSGWSHTPLDELNPKTYCIKDLHKSILNSCEPSISIP